MKISLLLRVLAGALPLGLSVAAEGVSPLVPVSTDAAVPALLVALQFRVELAAGIVSGQENAAAALTRLHAAPAPSGLAVQADADFGFAAIDIGERLAAAAKFAEATLFFRDAEISLDRAVAATPDLRAGEKALYLRKLALIRGRYLQAAAQAKADLDRALALQPEDKALQHAREMLARTNAEYFKSAASAGRAQP